MPAANSAVWVIASHGGAGHNRSAGDFDRNAVEQFSASVADRDGVYEREVEAERNRDF